MGQPFDVAPLVELARPVTLKLSGIMPNSSFNRVEIDLAALRGNYLGIRAAVGQSPRIMAVVKADAYGHGMVRVTQVLADVGARTFGVAEVEEGARLREAGVTGEIVVLLGALPDFFIDIIRYRLTPVVYDRQNLAGLSALACKMDAVIDVHLKVDVGMGRLGIMPKEVAAFASDFGRLAGVRLTGVLGHFPGADDPASAEKTGEQLARFHEILAPLAETGSGKVLHIANSAGLAYHPLSRLDMVRPGITLYGCHPDGAPGATAGRSPLTLAPVMSFKTRVVQVKDIPAGHGVSYGNEFVSRRPTRLAVLPVGYDDGYLRRLAGRAEVLIHGHRVPVRGRICMNACLADITDLPESVKVRPGDDVVLMGRQGDARIDADEVAAWSDTINYEVLCLFGNRNERVYIG